MSAMPFKANADRRHHIPKQQDRVTNWSEYDAALRQRGSLTVWFSEEAIAGWRGRARAGRATDDTGRSTALFGHSDRNRADLAGSVPPGFAPDRGADRLRHPS